MYCYRNEDDIMLSESKISSVYLFVNDESVEEDVNFALSAFIFAVSLFLVSENWVAMTTRQRLIMKKDPT